MKKIFYLGIVCAFLLSTLPSCKKKSYPCPGLGQMSEADVSKFDEKGGLKDGKGKKKKAPTKRIDHDSGLVNKKSPKQIKAQRKTHL
jgi:hypothetical protein